MVRPNNALFIYLIEPILAVFPLDPNQRVSSLAGRTQLHTPRPEALMTQRRPTSAYRSEGIRYLSGWIPFDHLGTQEPFFLKHGQQGLSTI